MITSEVTKELRGKLESSSSLKGASEMKRCQPDSGAHESLFGGMFDELDHLFFYTVCIRWKRGTRTLQCEQKPKVGIWRHVNQPP